MPSSRVRNLCVNKVSCVTDLLCWVEDWRTRGGGRERVNVWVSWEGWCRRRRWRRITSPQRVCLPPLSIMTSLPLSRWLMFDSVSNLGQRIVIFDITSTTFRWSPLGGGFNRTGIGCMLTGPSRSTMNPEKSRSRQTTIQMTTTVEAKKRSSLRMILSTSGVWTRRYADDLWGSANYVPTC